MATIWLTECSDAADGQKWNAMADGRFALEMSTSPRKSSIFYCDSKISSQHYQPEVRSPAQDTTADFKISGVSRSPIYARDAE